MREIPVNIDDFDGLQTLIDTGEAWSIDPWLSRYCAGLIAAGVLTQTWSKQLCTD